MSLKKIPTDGIIGAARLAEAATGEYRQIMELTQAALVAKLGLQPEYAWQVCIEAIFAERVIIRREGRFWSYGYTLGADNKVTLADAQEVVENYVPVALREAFAQACFIEAAAGDGSAWDAILVRAGKSKNKTFYPDAVLREAAPLYEGAHIYAKSDDDHRKGVAPDVNKLVGWISGAHFVEGAQTDTGYLAGRVNIAAGAAKLRETITDAWKRGKRDLVALSHDVYGTAEKAMREGVKYARSITKVNSVDLIVEPGAGGGLVRLVEAAADPENDTMKKRMLEAIKQKLPAKHAQLNVETATDEDIEALYREAIAPAPAPAPAAQVPGVTAEQLAESLRMVEARASARVKVYGTKLPKPVQDRIWSGFETREKFVEADVDAAIKAEKEYAARLTESGHVSMGGLDIEVEDRSKKIGGMLDAFFDPKHKDHATVHSFKECYIEVTGDKRVTGRWENVDRARLAESVGAAFLESLDSSSFANVLGDSITRRMVADYREKGQYDVWRQACDVVPITDFRTNERTRFGGYGDLAAVAQGAPYVAMASPTDEKATYAVTKRGGTEDITLEMIKNDDVGTIRRIPVKLARAAKRTLAKFALDFVRTNPTLYDSVAFFHATHANLGSAALDATSLAAARLRMLKQAELNSADRLGIGPRNLWVAPDGEEAAVDLFRRNTNNDQTFVNSLTLNVLPVWYWTDANDWAISADVMDVPGIEIGFLDNQQEPELFVQDNPTVGSMFTNDKVTYKIRHIYGGNVVEFRGWDKSVVA